MNNVITVDNLEKSYDKTKAVDGISFVVKQGEVLGLLGPNGAGKSTIINILGTILTADQGEVTIMGYNLKKDIKLIKKVIGIVPQEIAIYEEIPAIKNVRFFASLYNLKGKELEDKVKYALELVGLYDKKDQKPKTFSGGMKRRLNIACGIVHQPKVIILDEPTVGIDPQSRNHILESIKTLKQNGSTVIYSTHYMEEVEAISDRIIIMNEGNIIAEGTKEDLGKKVNDTVTYTFILDEAPQIDDQIFYAIDGVVKVEKSDNKLIVTTDKNKDNLNEIISKIIENNYKIDSMSRKEATLEDIFLDLTGRSLRD